MRKAALHNLGCKVNAYETEAMEQLLKESDVVIINLPLTPDTRHLIGMEQFAEPELREISFLEAK